MKSLGQVAYEAYFEHSKGKSLISGAPLPSFAAQKEEVREAWEAAASAVSVELSKRIIT
jgi:hypothetical protein